MAPRRPWWTALLLPLFVLVAGDASPAVPPPPASGCPRPSSVEAILGSPETCSALRRSLGYRVGVIEVNEATLAKAIDLHTNKEDYVAVLIYASWCSFSQECRPHFETLAYLFPTIRHFALEESSVRLSIMSRYGIHGYPALFLISSKMRVRYHGPRTVQSLAAFYTDVSGVNASMYSTIADAIPSSYTTKPKKDAEQKNCPFWWACSPKKILQQDTYLALAAAFVILRFLYVLFPKFISVAQHAWTRHTLFANLMSMHECFFTYLEQGREKFNRVYPSKRGNLHEGARSATAWASKSLASVAIGESSTARMNSANELT